MFRVYHSNQLDLLKTLTSALIAREPLADPFQQEVVLVQSPGMAQWLQMQLAEQFGVQGTPATLIGDQMLPGAVSYEDLEALVKQQLAKVKNG